MNSRLVAIAGSLNGMSFALTDEEISLGREASNQIVIRDSSVSRQHCLIKQEATNFQITDLDSFNGTFVNDLPVKERELRHGDRVRIGKSVFVVLIHEDEAALVTSNPVHLNDADVITGATIRLRAEDAFRLMARDLHALMKISACINSLRNLEELERALLELVFEVVPAERGAILLADSNSAEEFASLFGLDRIAGTEKPVQVSRTIVQKVLQEGIALLTNDVSQDEFGQTESLIAARSRALLCVPLQLFEKTRGVIYLETTNAGVARFDEDHLRLLTAIAGIAAVAIENARHIEWLESENRRLLFEINIEHNMIGESDAMRAVYEFIARAAPTDSTVLVRGESGTGKELVARAVHHNSPLVNLQFVAINYAALTETIIESELFGHERGAFTGAVAQKKGKLETADGGTLFLDEVAELAPALQAKLLRVLQEREFERVGGTRSIKVDVRLIAATNKDLEDAIKQGGFRSDLYYRLNVVSIEMPPLRARRADIPLLANYFVEKHSRKCKRQISGISPEARALLIAYDWPGNVREMENAIERAVVLGSSAFILPEDLPEALFEVESPDGALATRYHDAVREAKKQLILKAVEAAGGNYTEAATQLGLHPNYLHRLIRNMSLRAALKK